MSEDQWSEFLRDYIKNNPKESREISERASKFRAMQQQHEEAVAVLYGSDHTAKRKAFLDSLTIEDYKRALKRPAPEGLAEALAVRAKTSDEYDRKIMRVYDFFDYWELISVYESKHPRGVDILPTSPTTHLINRTITAILSGRAPSQARGTELERRTSKENNSITFVQIGENDIVELTLKDKDLICMLEPDKIDFSRTGRKYRDLMKFFTFILITCNDRNFCSPVVFSIHDMVKAGMYSDYISARKSFEKYMPRVYNGLDYSIKRRRGKSIAESRLDASDFCGTGIGEGHGFISSYELPPGSSWVTINIDQNFDIRTLAEFFTILPRWALALDPNPFTLVNYIFFRGRQETENIANKGCFNISIDRLRDHMGLTEYTGKDDYSKIKRPIMSAVEKVENAIFENNDPDIKITPLIKDDDITTATIRKWLYGGYLQIEFSGRYREYFSRLASERAIKIKAAQKAGARKKKAD